ncbi:hypothetical protein BHE74_00020640 [Ensete ventricosum]|nr:hypothetical protein BHE74_00020640 [Ensete ventricosum]
MQSLALSSPVSLRLSSSPKVDASAAAHRPFFLRPHCVRCPRASSSSASERHQIVESPPPPAPENPPGPHKLNRYSSRITEPKSQGGSQAILYGVGLSDDDMRKPQVGVSSVWYEGNTCNMHLLRLAEAAREGVREAGMVAFRFNTIGVSDAISMGTRGMCYSLQSRDLIADSIETVMAAQWYDANISIPGCDKNVSFSSFSASFSSFIWSFFVSIFDFAHSYA